MNDTPENLPDRPRRRRSRLPLIASELEEAKAALNQMRKTALTVERVESAVSFIAGLVQNVSELEMAKAKKQDELKAVEAQIAERLKTADDEHAKAARSRAALAVTKMESELCSVTRLRDEVYKELRQAEKQRDAVRDQIRELSQRVTSLTAN